MKLLKLWAAIAIIALIPVAFSGCEDTPEDTIDESCEQQDMNEIYDCGAEKNVEVCCVSGADCVYKYNGVDYPDTDTGLNNLADALGCTYKSSDDYEEQNALLIKSLIALKERARNRSY